MPLITAGTITYGTSNISQVYQGEDLIWPLSGDSRYLQFDILTGGTITWYNGKSSSSGCTISYSLDGGATWTDIHSLSAETSTNTINVSSGDTICFKGYNTYYNGQGCFGTTAYFNIKGNIMSLIYGDDFSRKILSSDNRLQYLFSYTKAVDASDLTLPKNVVNSCYSYMFQDSSLITAPILPASTLAKYCYEGMFMRCSNLNYVKCLATDISATNCTLLWLQDAPSSGTFVKAANMSSWTTGSDGIPSGWTIIDN